MTLSSGYRTPMTRLSLKMASYLKTMHTRRGTLYEPEWDRTMLALNDRGLANFHRAARYGKSRWHWTQAGLDRAVEMFGPLPELEDVDD